MQRTKWKLTCVLLLYVILTILPTRARSADPIRVGVVSIDNYQALAFTELFHNPPQDNLDLRGLKVLAAWPGGSPDLEESFENVSRWKPYLKKQGLRWKPPSRLSWLRSMP